MAACVVCCVSMTTTWTIHRNSIQRGGAFRKHLYTIVQVKDIPQSCGGPLNGQSPVLRGTSAYKTATTSKEVNEKDALAVNEQGWSDACETLQLLAYLSRGLLEELSAQKTPGSDPLFGAGTAGGSLIGNGQNFFRGFRPVSHVGCMYHSPCHSVNMSEVIQSMSDHVLSDLRSQHVGGRKKSFLLDLRSVLSRIDAAHSLGKKSLVRCFRTKTTPPAHV